MSELTRNATLAAYEANASTYCARYEALGTTATESRPPEALETLYRR